MQLPPGVGAAAAAGTPWGAIAAGGLEALSSLLGGAAQNKLTRQQLEEQQRQFNKQYDITAGGTAVGLQRQLETNPLRDRLLHTLMQRMGMPTQQFVAKDMFNPQNGPPQAGGIDFGQLASKMNTYTPGAGGANPQILQQFLSKIGYGSNPAPQRVIPSIAEASARARAGGAGISGELAKMYRAYNAEGNR